MWSEAERKVTERLWTSCGARPRREQEEIPGWEQPWKGWGRSAAMRDSFGNSGVGDGFSKTEMKSLRGRGLSRFALIR